MSNIQEPIDSDSDWYRAECAKKHLMITEEREESFLERVGIMVADGIDEDAARIEAFKGIYG